MKKLFLLLAVVAMILPSCENFSDEFGAIDDRLDKLEQISIPTIEQQIESINTQLTSLKATDDAIKARIAELENSDKTTATEISNLKAKDEALEDAISDLQEYVDNQIANAKSEAAAAYATIEQYNAIVSQLSELKSLTDKLGEDLTAKINNEVKSLTDRITDLENRLKAVEDKVEDLLSRIQSVSYIPTYSDGKATMKYAGDISRATLDFEISPKDAVAELAQVWESALSAKAVYTQTRAVEFVDTPIVKFEADEENGTISMIISGENLSEEFFTGTQEASVALVISDGNNSVTSEYIPMVAKDISIHIPEIVVTPIESTNPFLVRFNVKCVNADVAPVVSASYACNYVREFYSALQYATYSQLVEMNTAVGIYLSANELRQMNSPQGCIMEFLSREDATTGLVVMGWNADGYSNNPDAEGSQAYAETRSAVLPDAERVESSLFEELKGDWTLSANLHAVRREYVRNEDGSYVKDENGNYLLTETPVDSLVKSKVTIGDITYPDALTEDIYALYEKSKISREETDALFAEFKRLADHNNRKIRGQNRLLCNGLDLDALEISYKDITDYASPWNLFTSSSYSCWTVEDIFYDFGPKWYLQIDQNGNLFIPVNINRLLPMSNWKNAELLFIGYDKANNGAMMAPQTDSGDTSTWPNLPVELSEDKNTMTLKPFIYTNAGVEYSFAPTIIIDTKSKFYGMILMSGQVVGEIVLTRGWTEPEPAPAMLRRNRQSYTPDLTMTSVKSLGAKVANTQPSVYERTDFSKLVNSAK